MAAGKPLPGASEEELARLAVPMMIPTDLSGLANPTDAAICRLLAAGPARTVAIAAWLRVPERTVRHRLYRLRQAGAVVSGTDRLHDLAVPASVTRISGALPGPCRARVCDPYFGSLAGPCRARIWRPTSGVCCPYFGSLARPCRAPSGARPPDEPSSILAPWR